MLNKTILLTLLATCLMLWSCDTKTKTVDSCGDGIIDPGEDCDQIVGEATCGSLGHYNVNGVLTCKSDCTFELSDCGGMCGDGVVELPFNEECDGENLGDDTCQTLGFIGGTLSCSSGCQFDTSACESTCGNGALDATEPCDGFEMRNATCLTLGYGGGALTCTADCTFDESACQSDCGNNILEPDEDCESGKLR